MAAVRVVSADVFDAIDAHGHEYEPASIECATCRDAMAREGFCEKCLLGFANGQLYCSRLSYCLSRGKMAPHTAIACSTCRAQLGRVGGAAGHRWCAECGMGMVGHVAFSNRLHYDDAACEYERLRLAVETLERCEPCAVMMFTGGACLLHGKPKR